MSWDDVDFDHPQDEVPPYCCGHVEERINLGSIEHEVICGDYAPEYKCHDARCGEPICDKHVKLCEECEDEYHDACLRIVNRRFVCASCSLTIADAASFGDSEPPKVPTVVKAA